MATSLRAEDYGRRLTRAARAAEDAGLAGMIVKPGPLMVWLCGYTPARFRGLMTALVVSAQGQPRLLVPADEEAVAEQAAGAGVLSVAAWAEGAGPYGLLAKWLGQEGRYGDSDMTWAR